MFFIPFADEFPKIAEKQTRSITVFDDSGDLPKGEYGLINAYCSDKKCDCRRAMINVFRSDGKQEASRLAVISFGWESKSYYRKWSAYMSDEELAWFKGPGLDPYQSQSKYAETLLLFFKMQLQDEAYRNRLIRHYAQFKRKVGMKLPKDLEGWVGSMQDCGCGSGLAFKFCCGGLKR